MDLVEVELWVGIVVAVASIIGSVAILLFKFGGWFGALTSEQRNTSAAVHELKGSNTQEHHDIKDALSNHGERIASLETTREEG